MDLDQPRYDVSEVALLAGISVKFAANLTDRGLTDPYRYPEVGRRGRGRARRYCLRDALHFALVAELTERFRLPISYCRTLCWVAFSDSFSPGHRGFYFVNRLSNHPGSAGASLSLLTEPQLFERIKQQGTRPCFILNPGAIYDKVAQNAEKLVVDKERDQQGQHYVLAY